jgi:uncharacterized membrane protein
MEKPGGRHGPGLFLARRPDGPCGSPPDLISWPTKFRLPPRLLPLLLAAGLLAVLVQFGVLAIAFGKLGLSAESAYLLLVTTLAGSLLNMPLFTVDSSYTGELPAQLPAWLKPPPIAVPGKTLIAINIGGCVVPVAFSAYLFLENPVAVPQALGCIALVAAVAHAGSRPIPGVGIGIPILLSPAAAALAAIALGDDATRAPLAYIGGTLGVLIGADLLRLRDIRALGAPVAAIGGAGSFDGIFVSGLVAVLLA